MRPLSGPRKLLVAAIGVATINYVGCDKGSTPAPGKGPDLAIEDASTRPLAVDPVDAGASPIVDTPTVAPSASASNTPPPSADAGQLRMRHPTSGNLPAPPPAGPQCNPKWYLDETGVKHYKPECIK